MSDKLMTGAFMKAAVLLVLTIASLIASLVVSVDSALAQASGAEAETLFRQGKALMAQGKTAEACAAFDASQKIEASISTLLNQANCREKNAQLATAWGLFLKVEQQTRAATDEINRQMREVATERASKLEARLSTLTITVPAANQVAGLEVLRDGERVEAGAWNRALPVDGGTYQITARAPGNAAWSSTVTVVAERDVKTIEIPQLKAAALQPPPKVPAPDREEQMPGRHRSNVVPLALGGAAVALAGGAVGFFLWGDSLYDQSKKEADDAKQSSLWRSANTRRYVADGMAAASVACAGVAIWLYLRSGRSDETNRAASARILVNPIVSADQAGLIVSGRY
jgi:hypothetical protein